MVTSHFIFHSLGKLDFLSIRTNRTVPFASHLLIADPNAPRKRRSRWGEAKTELPGLPTAISANGITQAQLDNYAIHLRLEEINRKLRMNDFIPPERERYVLI